jgi:hypothetical protein
MTPVFFWKSSIPSAKSQLCEKGKACGVVGIHIETTPHVAVLT